MTTKISFIVVLTLCCALLLSLSVPHSFAAPLLMEGKKTLYQRVISHPNSTLYDDAQKDSTHLQEQVRPFTVFYVYERAGDWLKVGVSSTQADGWLPVHSTTEWKQALTLLFTDRSQREPVLFFKDHTSIMDVCQNPKLSAKLTELRQQASAAQKSTSTGTLPIIATEPDDSQGSVARERFYLMPILKVDTPFEGTKLLEVASIDPGTAGSDKKKSNSSPAPKEGLPRTGIAVVIDTTISMKPYIEQTRNVVRSIFDSLNTKTLKDSVAFGIVAFRSSIKASPKLEYTSTVISDFRSVSERAELEAALAAMEEAKSSSHSFNEDSLAGVKTALDNLHWAPYTNRVLLLITDAGPLPLSDPNASTSLDVQEMADLAASRGIRIVALHVRTPAGKNNADYARKAYNALSDISGGKSAYIPIDAGNHEQGSHTFAQAATNLSKALAISAQQALDKTPPHKPKERTEDMSPEEQARLLGEQLGYAMRLEYLGRKQGVRAPEVLTAWIADADLDALSAGRKVDAVTVAVLLSKNQLSDLQQQLKIIIDNAERTRKTDSRDFFQGILSASAQMARDPGKFSQKPQANLKEMGVLGEFLDDLPYKSDVMLLSEEDWYRMSVGEQTSFINRLKSRIARYDEYDKDVNNWESFGAKNSGDWVYRVPLNMLP